MFTFPRVICLIGGRLVSSQALLVVTYAHEYLDNMYMTYQSFYTRLNSLLLVGVNSTLLDIKSSVASWEQLSGTVGLLSNWLPAFILFLKSNKLSLNDLVLLLQLTLSRLILLSNTHCVTFHHRSEDINGDTSHNMCVRKAQLYDS